MSTFPTALPTARTPAPMDAPPLRWGVIGPGWIAERFIGSVRRHTRQQVLAVGSRDLGRSTAFAAKHGIDRAYGSYQDLLADPDIDVVYIATPHNAHLPHALLALEAGKHTVVEKPLALNEVQRARVHLLETMHEEVSASELRRRLRAGEDASDWVQTPVLDYIHAHGLYGAPRPPSRLQ